MNPQSLDSPQSIRLAARAGRLAGQTAGLAPGYVQGNLVVLPSDVADDFLRFCYRNPKPCPIIGVSERGRWDVPALGVDIDLRTDLPSYRVWHEGEMTEEVPDVSHLWREDLVAFVLGCSFSFEEALAAEGIPLKHVEAGTTVPMYRTNVACHPAGIFDGPMVVSMRPLSAANAIRAVQITSRFPAVHGAPIHLGDPRHIGIADITRPDYGDPVDVGPTEMPVFWACGVTPQSVIATARIPFAITHAPGCMLVTDVLNSRLAAW